LRAGLGQQPGQSARQHLFTSFYVTETQFAVGAGAPLYNSHPTTTPSPTSDYLFLPFKAAPFWEKLRNRKGDPTGSATFDIGDMSRRLLQRYGLL